MVFAQEMNIVYRDARDRSAQLENVLNQLQAAHLATMKTLAFVVEAKDLTTRGHLERTHRYGVALARLMDPDLARRPQLGYGFLLHDIGKVGVPEGILGKEGPLTADEMEVMKTHTVLGAQIVAPMEFLGEAVDVIKYHHERWDGCGYPHGLRREAIPLSARIFAVVDAFDAMTSDRPYREALRVEEAAAEIARGSGRQFDPEAVEAFHILIDRLELAVAGPPTLSVVS